MKDKNEISENLKAAIYEKCQNDFFNKLLERRVKKAMDYYERNTNYQRERRIEMEMQYCKAVRDSFKGVVECLLLITNDPKFSVIHNGRAIDIYEYVVICANDILEKKGVETLELKYSDAHKRMYYLYTEKYKKDELNFKFSNTFNQ